MSDPEGGAAVHEESASDRALVFTVEGREFAVPVDSVVEIVNHRNATRVPRSAAAVEGIIPVRGRMVTLLDVRRCLALPPRPEGAAARVVIVGSVDDPVGLVVDGVSGVSRLPTHAAPLDIAALLRGIS